MRIATDDPMWAAVDDHWFSRTFTPELMDAARVDPSLWRSQADRIAKFPATALIASQGWAHAQRIAFAYRAPALGLPATAIGQVAQSLGPLILEPPRDLSTLADLLIPTAIAVATDALAAIPIVGPIAKAIGSLALFLTELARKPPDTARKYLPPLQEFDRNKEEEVMNYQLLPSLATTDWTNLFLPRLGNNFQVIELDTGFILTAKSHEGSGLGFIPSTQGILSAVQVFFTKKSPYEGNSRADHQDTGNFYAAPAQLMTSLDQQVQRAGAAMWSVNTRRVRAAWHDHFNAMKAFCADLWNGVGIKGTGLERLTREQRHLVIQQFLAPLHVGTFPDGQRARGVLGANHWNYKGGGGVTNILEAFIDPWCDRLAQRQRHYLRTIAVAYADPSSPAFKEKQLRDMLERNRSLLLNSSYRDRVDRRDVIDSNFRKQLFSVTTGSTFKNPTTATPVVEDPDPPRLDGSAEQPDPPLPPTSTPPFEVDTGTGRPRGGGAALAIGLTALGLFTLRKPGRRR